MRPCRRWHWDLTALAPLQGQHVTSENHASRTGVVRAMARSDHCRWVSKPRCARASSHVT
jgi:hypothetical protein